MEDRFINKGEAMAFCESVADPVVRTLLMEAYGTLIFKTPAEVKGQFDLLFFFKVLDAFLRDRERLVRMLQGDPDVWY